MKSAVKALPAVLGALLCICVPALPQTMSSTTFRVQIRDESVDIREYSAQLYDTGRRRVAVAEVRGREFFEFRDVVAGQYWLSLTDTKGASVHEELVSVGNDSWVSVELEKPESAPRPPGGPVSVARLQQKPSPQALHAFHEAQKLSAHHQPAKAAEELEEAIRLSPNFAAAYTNLAAQHLMQKQYQQAIEEASQAMKIIGPDAPDLANIAYAQYSMDRLEEAAVSARAALAINPASPPAHYILGLVLAHDPRTMAESVEHLEAAARSLPSARTNLMLVKQRLGEAP